MSSDLPNGWRRVRAGDVFRERKQKGREGLPVASVSIEHGLVLRSSLDRRIQSDLLPEGHSLVRKGDIAYNMMRMWQGACGLAEADCLISPAYVVMTPTEEIEPQFADKLLRSQQVIRLLHGYSQGIVDDRLRLYPDAFAQVPISLPPLDEQRQIATVLRSVDQAIAAGQRVAEQAEAVWHGLTERLIWDRLSKGPEMARPLGQALQRTDYGVNAPLGNEPTGYAVLRMGNLQDGWIEPAELRWGEIADAEAKALALEVGDILFNRTNSRDLVGKVALVRQPTDFLYASYIVRLRVNRSVADPYYLFAVMHSRRAQARFKSIATPGVSQSNINPTNLKKQVIPLPSLAEQRDIGSQLQSVETVRRTALDEVMRSRQIKSDLMSDLLSGRVRVPK
ncbi:MAG: hypothetical protein E5V62_03835 [Mesorhizobium sp.]|uniref:restriction endonuclease subunit S n=1 Tax=Mesorhizobium sp. TaxID=1871066 RepID=UPI000FD2C3C5|nr:restriction endonuclease subunit S [Mesorhizobium sp.]RVD70640.1 restriction endonuclease subunit S [Mesorhizobium sp. M4A.F.Ca.ET.029.04.2.1]TIW37025.1 MAG: hypothetical protein E5V62_03835 [Mesorhizobium sp.]